MGMLFGHFTLTAIGDNIIRETRLRLWETVRLATVWGGLAAHEVTRKWEFRQPVSQYHYQRDLIPRKKSERFGANIFVI